MWFGFISFNLKSRFKNVDVWAYCRRSLVADFLKLVLLLNLVVIERRNYGGFKIFMYSLMMFFFFFFGKLGWTKLLIGKACQILAGR